MRDGTPAKPKFLSYIQRKSLSFCPTGTTDHFSTARMELEHECFRSVFGKKMPYVLEMS